MCRRTIPSSLVISTAIRSFAFFFHKPYYPPTFPGAVKNEQEEIKTTLSLSCMWAGFLPEVKFVSCTHHEKTKNKEKGTKFNLRKMSTERERRRVPQRFTPPHIHLSWVRVYITHNWLEKIVFFFVFCWLLGHHTTRLHDSNGPLPTRQVPQPLTRAYEFATEPLNLYNGNASTCWMMECHMKFTQIPQYPPM